MSETVIYLSDTEAPAFIFVDKEHQGKDGKGWRQSKDEGAYAPDAPPEAASHPVEWTGTYVIERLIEAFKTDRTLPKVKGKGLGSGHPQIIHTDEDKWGWLDMPKEDNQIRANNTREQLDQMEEAFGWLTAQFKIDRLRAASLRGYCIVKARKWSLKRYCADLHVDRRTLRDRAEKAAIDIALALATCKVPLS